MIFQATNLHKGFSMAMLVITRWYIHNDFSPTIFSHFDTLIAPLPDLPGSGLAGANVVL
jgi:hypothetical protein